MDYADPRRDLRTVQAINDLPPFGHLVQSIANPVVWICGTAETWAPFFFVVGAERFTYGLANVAVIKEAMELLGFAPGRVRKPCSELHETDRRELVRILRSWGKLDEWSDTVR